MLEAHRHTADRPPFVSQALRGQRLFGSPLLAGSLFSYVLDMFSFACVVWHFLAFLASGAVLSRCRAASKSASRKSVDEAAPYPLGAPGCFEKQLSSKASQRIARFQKAPAPLT